MRPAARMIAASSSRRSSVTLQTETQSMSDDIGAIKDNRQRANEQIRRSRQRAREGKVRLCVVVDEADLCNQLRVAGFIGEYDADPEGEALARLLEHIVNLWIAPPTE